MPQTYDFFSLSLAAVPFNFVHSQKKKKAKYTDVLEKGLNKPATPSMMDASDHPDILKARLKVEQDKVADLMEKLEEIKKEKTEHQVALKKLKNAFKESQEALQAANQNKGTGNFDEASRSLREDCTSSKFLFQLKLFFFSSG